MKIKIVSKQVEAGDDLRAHFEKKLKKLDKFFGEDTEAVIVLKSRKNGDKKLELTITVNNTIFRAEVNERTFENAIDSAIAAIDRQIRKNKTRLQKRIRSNDFAKATEAYGDDAEEEKSFDIRVKSFSFKPMSPEEAILQMNLLGHEFFVFENEATGKTNVVYKRDDNKYGLIEPAE